MKSALPERHFNRIFDRRAAGQRCWEVSIQILHVCEASNAALLMGPVQNRVCVLLPDLLSTREIESHKMAAERLMRIPAVGGVPVPLGIPVDDPSGSRDGIVLTCLRVADRSYRILHLAIAHIGEQGNDIKIVRRTLSATCSTGTLVRLRSCGGHACHRRTNLRAPDSALTIKKHIPRMTNNRNAKRFIT